jgi:hypothetical protein
MPPRPNIVFSFHNRFAIPGSSLLPSRPLVLAIRVWRWDANIPLFGAGFDAAPVIGQAAAIAELQGLTRRSLYWQQSKMIFGLFANLLTAIAALALFAMRRREREYLWFGVAQLFWAWQATEKLPKLVTVFAVGVVLRTKHAW